jgi:CubicO group peptidase (beta-lactamase class C family)
MGVMQLSFRSTIIALFLLFHVGVFAGEAPVNQLLRPAPQQSGPEKAPLSADTELEQLLQVTGTARIDLLLESAIARGLIAGGVVLIGDREGTLFEKAYGKTSTEPGARPMTIDTIFDIASLTKVVATTPAILKLAEERRISLVDPVVKWFPEQG